MKITTAQQQGPRPYQEDTISAYQYVDGGTLLAVFDGHGGKSVSETLSQYLRTNTLMIWHKNCITDLFKAFDGLTAHYDCGSTASVVYITPDHDKAFVGILGDSPVMILDRNLNLWVSPEHNVRTNAIEESRVVARGGHIFRGYAFDAQGKHGLQLSRAFGNHGLRHILSQEPDVFEIELGPQSWIVVASDGLVDPNHTNGQERINEIKRLLSYEANAETLVNNAITKGINDNVSAIVARINGFQRRTNELEVQTVNRTDVSSQG